MTRDIKSVQLSNGLKLPYVEGDRDEFLPCSDQEALATGIAGSRLVSYEGTGHVVHWEEPERVAADIVALAERLCRNRDRRSNGS